MSQIFGSNARAKTPESEFHYKWADTVKIKRRTALTATFRSIRTRRQRVPPCRRYSAPESPPTRTREQKRIGLPAPFTMLFGAAVELQR